MLTATLVLFVAFVVGGRPRVARSGRRREGNRGFDHMFEKVKKSQAGLASLRIQFQKVLGELAH